MLKKILIFLWVLFFAAVGAVFVYFYSIFNGSIGYMPNLKQLENPLDKFASQVYSADGKLLGTWSLSTTNRTPVNFNELPPHLVNALVATEDERYFEHSGVDFRAIMRAVVKRGLLGQHNAGGGSTITQQLAKQLYSAKTRNEQQRAMQKPVEWCIAMKLEQHYTKEEIIELYLNYFDFLYNAVGIKTASNTYFGKDPIDLDTLEAATLVGMCKNPSYYNPRIYPQRSLERRNVVLGQMVRSGFLTKDEMKELAARPLELHFSLQRHEVGDGSYMRDYLRQILMAKKPERSDYASWNYQAFYDDSLAWETDPAFGWCNKNKKKNGESYNIYTDGLKIYTTLDSRMQKYAEEAVREWVVGNLQPAFDKEQKGSKNAPYFSGLTTAEVQRALARAKRQSPRYIEMQRQGSTEAEIDSAFNTPVHMEVYTPNGGCDTILSPMDSILYYKSILRTGFMCMDNQTGAVRAYVGGLDYKYFQYDMCMKGRRQVGSTMKPFLYSLAMQNGMCPDDTLYCIQRTYVIPGGGGTWTPRNGTSAGEGTMQTLAWGLMLSHNWMAAQLMDRFSPYALIALLRDFGIRTQSMVPSPSLCLGPCDISVSEMVSAYTAFPMKGVRRSPLLITQIADSDGRVLETFRPRTNPVLSDKASYKMIHMMRGVINSGTGARMRNMFKITADMGGKTGTTNSNSDGWFMGYTPQLTFGAWVGGDDRDVHFRSTALGQGANASLPICALFLKKVYGDERLGISTNAKFDIPTDFNPNERDYVIGEEFYVSPDIMQDADAAYGDSEDDDFDMPEEGLSEF